MRPALPLFTRILACFFLNMMLVAVALAAFFAFQPHVDLHAVFGREGTNRLRTAGLLIAHDLGQTSRDQWSAVLARHARIHGVDFTMVLADGFRFASTPGDLPEPVLQRVRQVLPPAPPRHRPPPPHHGAGQRRPPNRAAPDPLPKHAMDSQPPRPPADDGVRPHCMRRTRGPVRYWSGIRISLPAGRLRPPLPGVLVAVSDSVTGRGFYFDPLPWMIVAAAVMLISTLFWIPMVRNITRPLTRMTRATEAIATGRFDVAIHEPRSDEIGRLARAINHMTSRLSALVTGQKRFLGDVAHELGSPIARIQFGLGALEQRVGAENRQRVVDVMDDVAHLSGLVNELLAFSRAEMTSKAVNLECVDLLPVVEAAVRRETSPSAAIRVRVDPKIHVVASAELLIRALANLLSNAVKYAGDAGPIIVAAEAESGGVFIEVRDQGPGVPDHLIDQLFEPFFRPEASRDRDSGGVGLGLAIVKTCVEACRGSVSATNLSPTGFAVRINLAS